MKTLIFQGSPHEHGDTAYLTGLLAQRLSGEVRTVHAYRCAIRPCVDCRACWKTPGCRINDGMQAVYAQIRESDHIVIASPLYFSELTGPLLSVMSRLQMNYAAGRFLHVQASGGPKTGALILCGGGDGSPDRAQKTALSLFRFMHAKLTRTILSLQTDAVPSCEDAAAIQKTLALAGAWNREAAAGGL